MGRKESRVFGFVLAARGTAPGHEVVARLPTLASTPTKAVQGLETPPLRLVVESLPADQRKTRRSSPPILASSRTVRVAVGPLVSPLSALVCPCLLQIVVPDLRGTK